MSISFRQWRFLAVGSQAKLGTSDQNFSLVMTTLSPSAEPNSSASPPMGTEKRVRPMVSRPTRRISSTTSMLSPRWAVVWAAFFNFIAFLFFGLHVANTIGKGVVDPAVIDSAVVFAALAGAIAWDLITWYWGLSTSSSHALIGGFAGAAVVKAGFGALVAEGLIKIGVFMIVAPLIGGALAAFAHEFLFPSAEDAPPAEAVVPEPRTVTVQATSERSQPAQ